MPGDRQTCLDKIETHLGMLPRFQTLKGPLADNLRGKGETDHNAGQSTPEGRRAQARVTRAVRADDRRPV
jgi:hypothetical protein